MIMESVEDFLFASQKSVKLFNNFVEKHSLIGRVLPDHICYKCGSTESFENIRKLFEGKSKYIYQSIISKRRIAIIRFETGIETKLGTINFLELSDQKPESSQQEGFEHIEAYPVAGTYDELVSEFEATEEVLKVERPHHTTHDIDIGEGFLFRCTKELVIEKIKRSEMT